MNSALLTQVGEIKRKEQHESLQSVRVLLQIVEGGVVQPYERVHKGDNICVHEQHITYDNAAAVTESI